MKGDFSRQTFDPRKHYGGVLMQQGRVQLDADWNEQDAIGRYRDEKEAVDTIGRCGGPLHAAGFEITTDGKHMFIGQGRYWVDGILIENDLGQLDYDRSPGGGTLDFDDQPYLSGGKLNKLLASLNEKGANAALVYLDVWQRHVTALEDGRLREVALGGPDTTTRIQTVWQVKLLPISQAGGDKPKRDELLQRRTSVQADFDGTGQALIELAGQVTELKTRIDAAQPGSAVAKRLKVQLDKLVVQQGELDARKVEIGAALSEIDKLLAALGEGDLPACGGEIPGWNNLSRRSGLLNARAQPSDPSDDPCELPPGGGYTRLENQLYRVEIHRGGALGTATFKWSRDNGTVVAAIEQISGSTARVDTLGPDDVLGLAEGQWVELLDDKVELSGKGGQLAKITGINPATRELTLEPAPEPLDEGEAGVDRDLHPRVRRWDQAGGTATANGVPTGTDWLPLEDGVEVQFTQPAGTVFRPGDYWTMPARTATADLEWPPFETPNLNPQPQPPAGIEHHFCRLALITFDDEKLELIEDCRTLFPPLTELCCALDALHVTATTWENDTLVPAALLSDPGLRITLDAPPDPASVSNDSVVVTYDFPYRLGDTVLPNIRERLVVLGTVGLDPDDPKTIVWRFQEANADQPEGGTTQPSTGGGSTGGGGTVGGGIVGGIFRPPIRGGLNPIVITRDAVAELAATRVRNSFRFNVTLRGSFIWRTDRRKRIYLDGQALGVPVHDPGSKGLRTDLDLPSGDGRRASDFESWFYLGTQQETKPLQVESVTFRTTLSPAPRDVLTVKEFTTDPAKFEQISQKDSVNVIVIQFSRAVNPQDVFTSDEPAPVLVEMLGPNGRRFIGQLTVKANVAEFIARDPEVFKQPGDHRITVFAATGAGGIGVTAQDDGSTLDGNFDGQPGTNFFLMFRVNP